MANSRARETTEAIRKNLCLYETFVLQRIFKPSGVSGIALEAF